MNGEPTLSDLLTRAKLVDDAARLVRQIQLKLDRVVKQHQREVTLMTVRRRPPKRKP